MSSWKETTICHKLSQDYSVGFSKRNVRWISVSRTEGAKTRKAHVDHGQGEECSPQPLSQPGWMWAGRLELKGLCGGGEDGTKNKHILPLLRKAPQALCLERPEAAEVQLL